MAADTMEHALVATGDCKHRRFACGRFAGGHLRKIRRGKEQEITKGNQTQDLIRVEFQGRSYRRS